MSTKKAGGKPHMATSSGAAGTSFKKINNLEASVSAVEYPTFNQPSSAVADFTSISTQNGEWEVIGKRKNKVSSMIGKQPGSNSASKAWTQPGAWNPSAVSNWVNSGDPRTTANTWNVKQQPGAGSIPPPLQHGWQWSARGGANVCPSKSDGISQTSVVEPAQNQPAYFSDDDDDALDDGSDEDFSDDYDSDASQRSHETRKMNKWFKGFFENLDKLTAEEMSEQTRQWHCPACHNGPGAIDWYDGLQPLITHAKTKRSTRPKLHRELAVLLDEELRIRGASLIPAGEAFGKWKGLRESTTDREIVWPPMVIVMNTKLEKDENDKWVGMGNQELLEYFSTYAAKRARHSYGPYGHRGMSVLIFEPSAMGYMEAERLHKHFVQQGTSREKWERGNPVLFYHGGKRQLYGYLARKEDMDIFNQHSQGKSRLKFDMRSYQEVVVIPLKQMNEDNQQLTYLKNKVVKEKEISKALKDTVVAVTQKLRETSEDNRIVRLRTKMQHEESKEMMDYQERFFKDQIEKIHQHTEEKEKKYETLLQEERAKAKIADSNSLHRENSRLSKKIENFIEGQTKDVEAFEMRREALIRAHDEKKISLRRSHLAEEVHLEQEFDAELTQLMEEFAPTTFQSSVAD